MNIKGIVSDQINFALKSAKTQKISRELQIDARNQGLSQFDEIYEELIAAQNHYNIQVSSINLKDNKLKRFLSNEIKMSLVEQQTELVQLTSVRTLNLLGNLDLSVQEAIAEAQVLMPNIVDLQISLSLESDVSFIMDTMPQLQILNGIQVQRDLLEQIEESSEAADVTPRSNRFKETGETFESRNPKDVLQDIENTLSENPTNESKKPRIRRKSKNVRRMEKSRKENKAAAGSKAVPKLDEDYIREKATQYARAALENCENEMKQAANVNSTGALETPKPTEEIPVRLSKSPEAYISLKDFESSHNKNIYIPSPKEGETNRNKQRTSGTGAESARQGGSLYGEELRPASKGRTGESEQWQESQVTSGVHSSPHGDGMDDPEVLNLKKMRQNIIDNNSYLDEFHSGRRSEEEEQMETLRETQQQLKLQELEEMRQLEDLLGPDPRQLSEIIEEEREECEIGELGGPSENKFTSATLDKGASRDGSNILSSMASQESKVKGMGSGIAAGAYHDNNKSPKQRQEDCQTTFQLSQKNEDDASLEISKSQIIEPPVRELGSVMRRDGAFTPLVRDQSELDTARMSLSVCSEAGGEEIEVDETVPHLKPKDLEDLAGIVDRIRVLYKKKDDSLQPPPKKLIAKCPAKIDEIAKEFDEKLSATMLSLSASLRDSLLTNPQKWAQIEKCKFDLYIFCSSTAAQFLVKHKKHILSKDSQDLSVIFQKIRTGMENCFKHQAALFATKQEQEVYETSKKQMAEIQEQIESLRTKTAYAEEQMNKSNGYSLQLSSELTELGSQIIDLKQIVAERNSTIRQNDSKIINLGANLEQAQQRQQAQNTEKDDLIRELRQRAELAEKEREQLKAMERIRSLEQAKKQVEHDLNAKRQQKAIEEGTCKLHEMQRMLEASAMRVGELQVINQENKRDFQQMETEHENALQAKDTELEKKEMKIQLQFWVIEQMVGQQKNKNRAGSSLASRSMKQQFLEVKKHLLQGGPGTNDIKSYNCPSNYARSPLLAPGQGALQKRKRSKAKPRRSVDCESRSSVFRTEKSPLKEKGRAHTPNLDTEHSVFLRPSIAQDAPSQKSEGPATMQKFEGADDIWSAKKLTKVESQIIEKSHQKELIEARNGYDRRQARPFELSKVGTSPKGNGIKRIGGGSRSRSGTKSENSYKKMQKTDAIDDIVEEIRQEDWENQDSEQNQTETVKDKDKSHDGHIVSMQDCDPSPSKKMQERRSDLVSESYYRYEDQHTTTQPNGFIDLGFANDNSSVIFTQVKNLDSKKLSASQDFSQEAFLENLGAEYANRRTGANTLLFNGIGFSFNETQNVNKQSQLTTPQDQDFYNCQIKQDSDNHLYEKQKKITQGNKKLTTKVIMHNLGTMPGAESSSRETALSKRSKSTPSGSLGNLMFVGGQMGQLPGRIQGTSDTPVASIQANQAVQVQNLIRSELKFGSVDLGNHVFTNFSSFVGSPTSTSKDKRSLSVGKQFQLKQQQKSAGTKRSSCSGATVFGQKNSVASSYSLKQIKDFIQDIYLQKIKNDDKCVNQNKQTRETMEQYLYTYLNQKYGLKSIVIEQAKSIVAAIGNYHQIDHDVHLFEMVLKHEIDEEFRYKQLAMKKSVTKTLRQVLVYKHPMKSANDIDQIQDSIITGKSNIDHAIWTKIVKQLFGGAEAEKMLILVKEKSQQSQQNTDANRPVNSFTLATESRADNRKKGHAKQKSRTRHVSSQNHSSYLNPKIAFSDLLDTILADQMDEHISFLGKFLQLFKVIDSDTDGIISIDQFIDLYQRMNIIDGDFFVKNGDHHETKNRFNKEIDYFLDILDPYQCDKIPLSDIIKLFSSHKVEMLDGQINKYTNSSSNLLFPPIIFEKVETQQTDSEFYNTNQQQIASEAEVCIQKPHETTSGATKQISQINVLRSDLASRTIEVLSIQEAKLNLEILELERQLQQN